MLNPVSSRTSRRTHSSSVSPTSRKPATNPRKLPLKPRNADKTGYGDPNAPTDRLSPPVYTIRAAGNPNSPEARQGQTFPLRLYPVSKKLLGQKAHHPTRPQRVLPSRKEVSLQPESHIHSPLSQAIIYLRRIKTNDKPCCFPFSIVLRVQNNAKSS